MAFCLKQKAVIGERLLPFLQEEAKQRMLDGGDAGAAGAEYGVQGAEYGVQGGRGNKKPPPVAISPQGGVSKKSKKKRAKLSRDLRPA